MKALVWIIILVVVLLGGYWLWMSISPEPAIVSNTQPEPRMPADTGIPADATSTALPTPVAHVISYTSAGFSPANVTIKKGDTVRFVNNAAGQEVWPASAVHPTHSVYPQKSASDCLGSSFDACHGLKAGESWDFKFDFVGAWGFHDHLHPSKYGKITVE